jgi:hypothetical protein
MENGHGVFNAQGTILGWKPAGKWQKASVTPFAFMTAAEAPTNLLEIGRAVHRLLVNREMLVPGHSKLIPLTNAASRGESPCTPKNKLTK